LLSLVGILTLFTACKTSKVDNKISVEDLATLESLEEKNDYYIEINVAYPFMTLATSQTANFLLRNTGGNTANRIEVRGDGNFIEIKNDSVKGYLPFFGERRLNAGAYGGTDTSIQFEEPLNDLSKAINTNKGKLELEFTARQQGDANERYQITLDIFPNKKVTVDIRPIAKTLMRYDGQLTEPSIDK
jgi:hypothetical protein